MPEPFGALKAHHYGAILADPPWTFKTWSAKGEGRAPDYSTMTIPQVMQLPVAELAADDCVLFLWFCWPTLPDALRLIDAWGFTYKTCAFAWVKASLPAQRGLFGGDKLKIHVGLGFWTRANSEVCLLATRGKPKRLHADVRQAIIEPRREHSRKPDCVHERIERLVAGPYAELFARQRRPGWACWGNETEKFKPLEAVA